MTIFIAFLSQPILHHDSELHGIIIGIRIELYLNIDFVLELLNQSLFFITVIYKIPR